MVMIKLIGKLVFYPLLIMVALCHGAIEAILKIK